jgi:hypothetical protein
MELSELVVKFEAAKDRVADLRQLVWDVEVATKVNVC